MPKRTKRFTRAQKKYWAAQATKTGVADVADKTGHSPSTVQRWVNDHDIKRAHGMR